jgi:hypothetical protein
MPELSQVRPVWSTADIADAVEAGLLARRAADDAEQAIYGFDALPELGLHPLLHQSLRDAGFGVYPEQRYPGAWNNRKRSEGRRCDVVLTRQGLPLRDPSLRDTLFGQTDAEDADTAYWLEIKTVAQFEEGRPFRRYSAELFAPVTDDVRKIWSDGVIRFGGLLLVLFTLNQEVAEHDVAAWHQRCVIKGVPAGCPAVRGFEVADRVGNGWCCIAVFGVRGV